MKKNFVEFILFSIDSRIHSYCCLSLHNSPLIHSHCHITSNQQPATRNQKPATSNRTLKPFLMLTPCPSTETLSKAQMPPLKRRKPDSRTPPSPDPENTPSASPILTNSPQLTTPPSPKRRGRSRKGKTARARSLKQKQAAEGTNNGVESSMGAQKISG